MFCSILFVLDSPALERKNRNVIAITMEWNIDEWPGIYLIELNKPIKIRKERV